MMKSHLHGITITIRGGEERMNKRNLIILFLVAVISIEIIGCNNIKQDNATENTKETVKENEEGLLEETSDTAIKEIMANVILDYRITTGVLNSYAATYAVVPNGVMIIRDGTFSGCSKLKSIVMPNTVKSIGNRAFSGCSSLKSLTISDSVEYIGNSYTFEECNNLKSIIWKGGVYPSVDEFLDAFTSYNTSVK